MTMTTQHSMTAQRGMADRVLSVTRLHYVNVFTLVVLPWLILAFIFLINYLIWVLIFNSVSGQDEIDAREGIGWSGASAFIFVYALVLAVQAVNLTFPFAQGYSTTRRDFYLGTALAFLLLSASWSIALTVLSFIEDATNGWGVGGTMFTALYFGDGAWYQRLFLFFVAFLFFTSMGIATASVYVRWKALGMYVFWAALLLLVVGAAALVTTTESWPTVGSWFVDNGAYGVAAWSLVPTTVAAVVGYLILRRATPRN